MIYAIGLSLLKIKDNTNRPGTGQMIFDTIVMLEISYVREKKTNERSRCFCMYD